MKRLLTLLLLIPLFATAQKQYFTPGVPPGTTSFTPTFRYKATGIDSLNNLYIAIGNKTYQFYTSPQIPTITFDSLKFSGTGLAGSPLTFRLDHSAAGTNIFPLWIDADGYLVQPNINYNATTQKVLFNGILPQTNVAPTTGNDIPNKTYVDAHAGLNTDTIRKGYNVVIDKVTGYPGHDTSAYLPNWLHSDFRLHNNGFKFQPDSIIIKQSIFTAGLFGREFDFSDSTETAQYKFNGFKLYKKSDSTQNYVRVHFLSDSTYWQGKPITWSNVNTFKNLVYLRDVPTGSNTDSVFVSHGGVVNKVPVSSFSNIYNSDGSINAARDALVNGSLTFDGNGPSAFVKMAGNDFAGGTTNLTVAGSEIDAQYLFSGAVVGTQISASGIIIRDELTNIGLQAAGSIDTAQITLHPKAYVTNEWVTRRLGGSSGVTSLTPGVGFLSHTPITSTGTINIDTASTIQTIANFFPKGDTRYLKTSTASATYVPLTRSLTAGTGIQTIGDLSVNRTISADTSILRTVANSYSLSGIQTKLNGYVPTTRTVAGFALSSNVSLAALTATNSSLTFSGSYDGSTARTAGLNLANGNTFTVAQEVSIAGTGTSTLPGFLVSASDPATSGNAKNSGVIGLRGNAFPVTPAASQPVEADFVLIPTNGTTTPTWTVQLQSRINGGAASATGIQWTATGGFLAGSYSGGAATTNIWIPSTQAGSSTTTASHLFAGASTILTRISVGGGSSATTLSTGSSYAAFVVPTDVVTTFSSGTHAIVAGSVFKAPTITSGGATVTDAATIFSQGPPTGGSSNWNAWFKYGISRVTGLQVDSTSNFALGVKIGITEGTNGRVGQTTLVAGTKAISISGVTTSSRAFVTLVTPSGTSLTTSYQAVCTSGTLTIQANVAAGTINTVDVSVLNYFIIN